MKTLINIILFGCNGSRRLALLLVASLIVMTQSLAAKEFVLILDAGHGGIKPGAVGVNGLKEKDYTLQVILRVGQLISERHKDVKIAYTRKDDSHIGINERAAFANKNKGDLFISVHANSVKPDKNNSQRSLKGCEVLLLGENNEASNYETIKRNSSGNLWDTNSADVATDISGINLNEIINSTCVALLQDEQTEQSFKIAALIQEELINTAHREASRSVKRQENLGVLHLTDMPAVIVEVDFICNPTIEAWFRTKDGVELPALSIANAFDKYYADWVATNSGDSQTDSQVGDSQTHVADVVDTHTAAPDSATVTASENSVTDGAVEYRVQILSSAKPVKATSSEFHGEKNVDEYVDGGMYKYTVGHFTTMQDATAEQRRLRSIFPSAFVIKMVDGKRVR